MKKNYTEENKQYRDKLGKIKYERALVKLRRKRRVNIIKQMKEEKQQELNEKTIKKTAKRNSSGWLNPAVFHK